MYIIAAFGKPLRRFVACIRLEKVLRGVISGIVGFLILFAVGCARPSATQGRQLYEANGCISCHGKDGHGDGPAAPNLPASPIDFRDVSLFKRGTTEDAIAETLAKGVSVDHTVPALHYTHHELLMPSFDHLSLTDRRSIALYVISLRAKGEQGGIQE